MAAREEPDAPYRGLLGAYRYGFRQSRSWLFRSYVVTSALVGVYLGVLLALALVTWIASPAAFGDRALLGLLGIGVLVPLFAPVLIVARRYRRRESSAAADRLFALAGYAFVVAVGLALFVSDPSDHDVADPTGAVGWLDSLPNLAGFVPPVLAVALLVVVVRSTRPRR